jgi:GNAT superfamily N-acetyltransferase
VTNSAVPSRGCRARRAGLHLFDHSYVESAVLADGTLVSLRLVRPDDKALMREAWDRLSSESRYRRFLTPKNVLTEADLRLFTEVDQVDHFALGALTTRCGRDRGLGVARFVRLEGRQDVADVAVTVVDEAQRRGLGRLLLSRLIAAARERGIERFSCDMLATNQAMRSLIRSLVPDAIEHSAGGMVHAEMHLAATARDAPVSAGSRAATRARSLPR